MYQQTFSNPIESISSIEDDHSILCFCTLVHFHKNKKIKCANVFVTLFTDPELKEILKSLLGVDTDYDAILKFVEYEPAIHRSKYVSKFINQYKKDIHNNISATKGTI